MRPNAVRADYFFTHMPFPPHFISLTFVQSALFVGTAVVVWASVTVAIEPRSSAVRRVFITGLRALVDYGEKSIPSSMNAASPWRAALVHVPYSDSWPKAANGNVPVELCCAHI